MQATSKQTFQKMSGNPFEEESLPKAYYFPSLEKHLSSKEKKTSLSPNKERDQLKQTSKADAKFLRESNKFSSLEIPTREDGTVQHELSSGSQFDESWPSTDRNVSSLSPNTGSSSSTHVAVREKENLCGKGSNNKEKLSRQSTLSKYIDRFRHGTPTSREERQNTHESSGKDFWWLSPPSNTSTPKEPYNSTTSKLSISSNSTSKIKPNVTSTSPQNQKYRFKPNQFSRSVRETVDIMDSDATDLLSRTNQLLEKSESTYDEVSSESIPKPPSSWMLEKHKRLDQTAERKKPVITETHLAPEDDILYQWRLARRLEKAQAEAKDGHLKHFANTTTHRAATLTRCRYNAYLPEHPKGIDNMSSKHEARMSGRTLPGDRSLKDKVGVFFMGEKDSVCCREGNKLTQEGRSDRVIPLERNVPAVCFIDEEKLPSHVHMMCDIVPCSKQIYVEPERRVVDVKTHYPGASDIREDIRKPGQKPHAECHSPDIQEQEYFHQRKIIGDREGAEGARTHGVTSTACHPGSADKEKGKHETDTHKKEYLSDKEIIPNSKQQPVACLQTDESNSLRRTTTALESDKYDQKEIRLEETPDVENTARTRETMKIPDADELSKTVEVNEGKTKPVKGVESNDQTNLVNTSVSVSRISLQSDRSNDEPTVIQNKEIIGTVIGQVISERLFSSMSTSRRSSTSSNSSVSTECENVENKEKNLVLTSKECENIGDQELATTMPDDILFPDDHILTRLRQQAELYKGHLRNIDRILQQSTEPETSELIVDSKL